MIYILIVYMWVPSIHAGGGMTTAEFSSLERCEAAAKHVTLTFDGIGSRSYHVCVPK